MLMKKTRSKIFAIALATTTMAAFYAAPVLAAQEGLALNSEVITAAASVKINGVTLSGNGLTAAGDAFVVSRTGAVTAASLTATGAITANGKLTANNGSAITATTAGRYQVASNVAVNQISNAVKNYDSSTDSFVKGTSSVINGTAITDIVYDASGTKASSLALTRTYITGTVIGDKANSTITLGKTSASLKSGQKGFTVNDQGVITIAGNNFNVAANGAVTGKGFTSNNGAITIKNTDGTAVFNATTAGALTTSGKLTVNGGSTITATNDNWKAASSVTATAINNTIQNVAEGKAVARTGTSRAQSTTAITDTVYSYDNTTSSSLTLNQISATLKAGSSSVGINNTTGNVTITAKDENKNSALLSITSKNLSSNAASTTITAANTTGTATVTNVTNSTGITNKYVNSDTNVTVSSAVASTGITDTFTDGSGVTHKVVTDSLGTRFTGSPTDNRYNYSTIDGQKATFGGSTTNQTVIEGGTAIFTNGRNSVTTINGGAVTAKSVTVDELNIGGTTLDSSLSAIALNIENVDLTPEGLKLSNNNQETFKVESATGNVTTKGSIVAEGGITAASFNDVKIATDENNVFIGDVNITALNANTAGITRSGATTTIEGNTAVSSDGIVVSNDSSISTKTKADGYYVKDGNNVVAKLTADGLTAGRGTFGDNEKNVVVKNDGVYVKENGTVASKLTSSALNVGGENVVKVTDGTVVLAADRGTFGNTSSSNVVVKEDGIYVKDGNTVKTSLTEGGLNLGANTLTDQQLGYVNGMITDAGTLANVTSINGAAIEAVDATSEGSAAGLRIAGVTLQDGNVSADTYNGVTIEKNDGNVTIGGVDITQAGTDISALQQKTGGIVRRTSGEFSTTEIEGAAGVNNKSGFYVLGKEDETEKVATISRDGNMNLAGNIRAAGNASIAGTFITENDQGKASLSSSALNLSNDSGNTVLVRNDGIARFGALNGANVRMQGGVLTVNSAGTNGETKLSTEGLELTNAKLTTAGLDVNEKFNVDSATGNISSTYAGGTLNANADNFAVKHGDSEFKVDSNGATFTNGDTNGTTVINGGTITTETLNVDNIVLGNQIVDGNGDVIGGNLNIGADGSVKLVDTSGTESVTVFEATTTNFNTNYGGYQLEMNADKGFSLGYTNGAKLTLTDAGYAFSGALNLGNDFEISFTHNTSEHSDNVGRISLGSSLTLQTLVDKVEELDYRTQGISYDENGNKTTITSGESKLTVDENGTSFTNGEDKGTTNINGGVINADRSEIGFIESGSGAGDFGSSAINGNGIVSDADAQEGHFAKDVDGVKSSFEFTANADGYVSAAEHTENGVTYTSNVQNKADINSVSIEGDGSSSLREQTASSITNSVTAGDKSNSLTQTVDSTVSSVTDGTNTNTLKQIATETTSRIENGTDTYYSSQTASGSVTKVSDGENSSTVEQTATSHVITTTGEDGKEHSTVITGSDVVINQGTDNEVSLARTENRVTDLEHGVADLNRRVDRLEDRIDKVGAMAAAIANLRTMGYDPTAPTEFAIGIGQYRSDTGVALGLFHYPNRDFMLSLSVSTSGDEVMGGIGATWKFGRKKQPVDQEKVNKAEELKLAAQANKLG